MLGKSKDNPIVQRFLKKYPYYDIKEDSETKTIYFQHNDITFTPQELVGMILDNAKELASDFAEQEVDAAVITVPAYFNQAERKALLQAAEMANIKILQLMNSNAAAALNYGVFRRKDFNSTPQTLLFFDMGSSGTTATVVQYQMVKLKDDFEANPQLTVKGVGFDRTLGGNEFTHRLMNHLAKLFKEQKKKDVLSNPKAILKLIKEADRVKTVLSANVDHMAQVEGLMDDVDFKAKVTRSEFEELCADLFDRIRKPIEDAVTSAGVHYDDIQAIILMGGSTRIPRVQDELLKITGKQELGKNLNTDEAAALGAVYQAAYQSKGYKVKKFYVKDLNMYPIVVDFERSHQNTETPNDESLYIRRTLFDRNNLYPQKKIMTFNKHDSDFKFYLNYGDLSFYAENVVQTLGSLNISEVNLKGVKELFEKHSDKESKGIKVHFNMDESGVLLVDKIDVLFEKNETQESTLSKIGNTISSFFSSQDESNDEQADDKKNEEEKTSNPTPSYSTANETLVKNDSNTTAEIVPKTTSIKETIKFDKQSLDLNEFSEETLNEKKKRIELIKSKEKEKRKKASAINSLEAFIYDTKDKLEGEDFVKCSTQEERDDLFTKLNEVSDWLFDADDSVETKVYQDKLQELKTASKDIFFRVKERRLRPDKLGDLKEVLNVSSHFLETIRNQTGEDKPYTDIEVSTLEKLIISTKEWRTKMLNEQAKVPDYEQPKLLTSDINDKMDELKREVNYLISKAKYFRPKPKTTTPKPKTEETKPEQEQQQQEGDESKNSEETPSQNDEEKILEDLFDNDKDTIKRKPKVVREDEQNSDEKLELEGSETQTSTEEDQQSTANPEL